MPKRKLQDSEDASQETLQRTPSASASVSAKRGEGEKAEQAKDSSTIPEKYQETLLSSTDKYSTNNTSTSNNGNYPIENSIVQKISH